MFGTNATTRTPEREQCLFVEAYEPFPLFRWNSLIGTIYVMRAQNGAEVLIGEHRYVGCSHLTVVSIPIDIQHNQWPCRLLDSRELQAVVTKLRRADNAKMSRYHSGIREETHRERNEKLVSLFLWHKLIIPTYQVLLLIRTRSMCIEYILFCPS